MTAAGFELGLDSFGEVATDAGRVLSDAQTVRLIVAESVGLDVFGIGEHYRADVNDSAPPVLLAAIAAAERIRPRDVGDRARHERPGAAVSPVFDAGRGLERACAVGARRGLVID